MVNKTPRSASTRDKVARTKHWQQPSSLDTPAPPDGYKFRWIRESVRGYEDNKNVVGRIRQGYELVRADEYPDFDFPSIYHRKSMVEPPRADFQILGENPPDLIRLSKPPEALRGHVWGLLLPRR